MKNYVENIQSQKFDCPEGMIGESAQFAINEAIYSKNEVKLVFNEIELMVYPDSCKRDISRIFYLLHKLKRNGIEG